MQNEKKKRKKTGRPTVLTPELQAEFIKWIEKGNYIETASNICGVNTDDVRKWIRWGVRGKEGYVEFARAVKNAQGIAESRMLDIIDRAADNGVWQAAAWRLERMHPEKWGKWLRNDETIDIEGDIKRVKISWIPGIKAAAKQEDAQEGGEADD